MDSLFDARNCKYDSIFKAIRPALDSLKADTRARTSAILTPEQRAKLESRRRDHDAKDEAERKRIQATCHR
jgi:Spy/CpxP family protein refolding chaperone